MVDLDDVSVCRHARRRRRKKKGGEKKQIPKSGQTSNFQSTIELPTQGQCKEQIYVGYNTSASPIRRAL
jgi:hypothetical protein